MADSPQNHGQQKTVMLRHGNSLNKSFPVKSLVPYIQSGKLKGADKISSDGEKWVRLDKHPQLAKYFKAPDDPSAQTETGQKSSPSDKANEIAKLSKMLKDGAIEQEDFDQLKKEVLASKPPGTSITLGSINLGPKQILGILGSAMVFFGTFAPIVSVPFYGSMNYFQHSKVDGIMLLIVTGAALFAALKRVDIMLQFSSYGVLAILAFTFIAFQVKMANARSDWKDQLSETPLAGLGSAALQSVQLSWGWAILVLGAGILLAAGIKKDA